MSSQRPRIAAMLAIATAAASATSIHTSIARADPDPADQVRDVPAIEHDHADDADLDEHRERPRFDYSRYSDGPRRVPAPRGASKQRADSLGLGTSECASALLHGAPRAEWIAAARGREPSRLLWPVDAGRWVRGFGYVRTTRPDLIHRGIDIAADEGTTVRAAADGIVAYSDNGVRGYGNLVLIVHANGWVSLYAHNARTTVQAGYRVRRGERIALVGQTGIARGPHVHFELWQNGRAVDPAALFDGGPTFVQRIAAREARRGRVAPPGELSEEDRVVEAPLAPHPDDVRRDVDVRAPVLVSAAPVAPVSEVASAPEVPRRLEGLELGSLALARRLLSRAPSEASMLAAGTRSFSTLLFPLRGGRVSRAFAGSRTPLALDGPPESAVRVAADGLVVFAGELPGRGPSIVVLHRNGWVTAYVGVGLVAVRAGERVERGAWIARSGERALELELRIGGIARDPAQLLVQPES